MKKVLFIYIAVLALFILPINLAHSIAQDVSQSTSKNEICIMIPLQIINDAEKEGGLMHSGIIRQMAIILANKMEYGIEQFELHIYETRMCVRRITQKNSED